MDGRRPGGLKRARKLSTSINSLIKSFTLKEGYPQKIRKSSELN